MSSTEYLFKKKGTLKVWNIHYLLRTKDDVRILTQKWYKLTKFDWGINQEIVYAAGLILMHLKAACLENAYGKSLKYVCNVHSEFQFMILCFDYHIGQCTTAVIVGHCT